MGWGDVCNFYYEAVRRGVGDWYTGGAEGGGRGNEGGDVEGALGGG